MREDIFRITGKEKGPTSIVLAGVHGNERSGIEALAALLPTLAIQAGELLIGYGNPRAIEANQRLIETNLNRMFFQDSARPSKKERASYEYERAQFLKPYLKEAGALLDVHASRTPKSRPFSICEENAKDIIEYLPIDLVTTGFTVIEPGATDGYMNTIGNIGICVEVGYFGDPASVQTAKESIIAFLKARGHIPNDRERTTQSTIHMNDIYITRTDAFVLTKMFDDFEEVAEGQLIGTDGDQEVRANKNAVIVFARNQNSIGEEAFILGEKKNPA